VVGNTNATVDCIKQNIREFRVESPVLFYGDGQCVPRGEWQVRGTPIAYLVNPQGVIVGHGSGRRISELLTALDFYTSQPVPDPPLGLRCAWTLDNLPEVELILELRSPQRQPLDIEINYRYVDLVFDDTGDLIEVTRTCPVDDGPEISFTVDFDDSCERRWPVSIDALQSEGLEYVVEVRIPGSEEWQDGRGVWVWQGGELIYEYPENCRERAWSSAGPR